MPDDRERSVSHDIGGEVRLDCAPTFNKISHPRPLWAHRAPTSPPPEAMMEPLSHPSESRAGRKIQSTIGLRSA